MTTANNYCNVSLWINNDVGLYNFARDYARRYTRQRAAELVCEALAELGITHTPDGVKYSVSAIRAAMVGM